ncbi:hypothetical protein [Akkermansia muciniphila]|jgi:hypothetical protein|uniref:hypothetical protein n=1 Tax=Akkermansia muciniphila TaxID=239935 RepID=UPI0024A59FC9|nr:hypothetical protein [Akkermansia muciniphila]GLV04877.1 hypothetical protein Amuc02_05850 [Akkermansia muciniphila]
MVSFPEKNPLQALIEQGNGKAPLNIETAAAMCDWYARQLEAIARQINAPAYGETVWASQATLAKRYDMSKPSMCRYLMAAVESGQVRVIRPGDGDRQGILKYNVQDVDDYMQQKART